MSMKRLTALLLALLCILALIPAHEAEAAVLPGMTSKVDYDNTDPNRYVIEIDIVNQVITVYEGALGGAIVLQSLCTTGNAENPTNWGTYKLGKLKERFGYFVSYGQYAQYWTQVVRGIYIHSVMYDSKDLSSMSKAAYRNLGKNVSHGCVRVLPHVAQWIFYNCPPGTTCKVDKFKTADPALVKRIQSGIVSYSKYVQPTDLKANPAEIPAAIRYDNTPLRTGFSASRDTTILTLKANDKVLILQLADDWCKVKTPSGKLGYIETKYILCYPDEASQIAQAYAATERTYVYAQTSTSSQKLAEIPKAAIVDCTDVGMTYYYMATYNGASGYVRKRHIKLTTSYAYPEVEGSSPIPPAAQTPGTTPASDPAAPAAATGTRIRDGILASFRSSPSSASQDNLIAALQAGTPVTILSLNGSWYYCEVGGAKGYLHKACIAFD